MVLPVLAVGLVSLYVVFASPRVVDRNFEKQFTNLNVATEDLRMENPRFTGEDDEGRPYEVVAGAATQDPLLPDLISLENPEALRTETSGKNDQVKVTANSGLYDVEGKTIDLNNNVELAQGIGDGVFVLRTDAAIVSLDDRKVESKGMVYGESGENTLIADSMTAYEEEGRSVFYNARMTLKPKKKNPPVETTADEAAEDETKEDGKPKT